MTSVLLIYPYFNHPHNRSSFRFPPLGVGYVAASLRNAGYGVDILDCTFMKRDEALKKAQRSGADVVGIYSMVTMWNDSIWFARHLRDSCDLLIAGGPLPSCDPIPFMNDFDVVVKGEGEHAMLELLRTHENGCDPQSIQGIVYHRKNNGQTKGMQDEIVFTEPRILELVSQQFSIYT